jgi:rare lipoprotein A
MLEMRAKIITLGLLGTAAILPLDLAKADQVGHASWYALYSRTASGEMMDPSELTAAHRSLPFGTKVLVENLNTGRSVVVRINDRGPFIGGRIIDLSKAAAASIGMIDSGVAKVRVTTTGGDTLAALGASESTSRAKSGESLAPVDKPEITAVESPAKVETAVPAIPAKPKTAKSPTPSKPKVAAAKGSSKSEHAKSGGSRGRAVAAKSSTKSSVKSASKSSVKSAAKSYSVKSASKSSVKTAAKNRSTHSRVAAASKRRAGARVAAASAANPYAILGSAPGFMKSTQARRAG